MTVVPIFSKSRSAVVALAETGLAPLQIAARLGVQSQTVHHYLWLARRLGETDVKFKRGRAPEIGESRPVISPSLVKQLRPAADARRMTVAQLSKAILARVAEDGLIDAVLDDLPRTEVRHDC